MVENLHILFLTEAAPFPPIGGENIRSKALISALLGSGFQVSAITRSKGIPSESKNLQHHYFPDAKKVGIISQIKGLFNTDTEVTGLIQNIHQNRPIDIAVIDYFFLGQYIPYLKNMAIPVIYGTHNAQSELTYQEIQTIHGIEKIKRIGAWIMQKRHEKKFFPQADVLIVVSEKDKERHSQYLPNDRISVIPNFLNTKEYFLNDPKENYLVISGNFNSFQNKFGTEWFLREAWEKGELWRKTKLLLVGIGSDTFLKVQSKKINCNNIVATGKVDSINKYIGCAKMALVPIFHGSGSRFKILEALALGCPVISTTLGAEGIKSVDIETADSSDEFCEKITGLLNTDNNSVLPQKYTLQYNIRVLKKIICSLASAQQKKNPSMERKNAFIHVHIPKCGGTTFQNILQKNFKGNAYYRENPIIMHQHKSIDIELALQRASFIHVISSHHVTLDLPYHMQDPEVFAISFTRNPVDRFISHYYFEKNRCKEKDVLVFDQDICRMNLEEYVEKVIRTKDSYQHIKGQVDWLISDTPINGLDDIELLFKRGKLLLFPIEEFDNACLLLQNLFPDEFKDCTYISKNIGKYKQVGDDALVRKIKDEITEAKDFELHEMSYRCLESLNKSVFQTKNRLEEELEIFRKTCKSR